MTTIARRYDRVESPPDDRDYDLADYLQPAATGGVLPAGTYTITSAGEMGAEQTPAERPLPQVTGDVTDLEATLLELRSELVRIGGSLGQLVVREAIAIVETALQILDPTPPAPTPTPDPTPAPPAPVADVSWTDADAVLDQGNTGHCVGMGCTDWENTLPIDDRKTISDAHALYYQAVSIMLGRPVLNYDPPGSGPDDVENGTDVRSGLKALQANGRLATYARTKSITDLLVWLDAQGPIIIGVNWTQGMETPDEAGRIHPTGEIVGGHCVCLTGIQQDGHVVEILNSWGADWGVNGRALISVGELASIVFGGGGEAWAAVELEVAS